MARGSLQTFHCSRKALDQNPAVFHPKSMPCLPRLGLHSSRFLSCGQRLGAGKTRLNVPVLRKRICAQAVASDLQSKPTVLVAEKLGEAGLELLRSLANVDCSYNLSPEELCTKISLCDALIVRSGTKVTRDVFESSNGRLKVVGRAGVGIDNVDLQAATEFGCLVVNAPTANTVAAAEHGIALLASMARNVPMADASMKAGDFRLF